MNRIFLKLDIETEKGHSSDIINLGTNTPHVIGSEYFFCPLLSILLHADRSPELVVHSYHETPMDAMKKNVYRFYGDEGELLPPEEGAEPLPLKIGSSFTIKEITPQGKKTTVYHVRYFSREPVPTSFPFEEVSPEDYPVSP